MSTITATFEIDGEQVPSTECDWQLLAPCGCTHGLTVVHRGDEFVGTEQQAWRAFEPRKRDRDRLIAQGYTLSVARRHDAVAAYKSGCHHRTHGGAK